MRRLNFNGLHGIISQKIEVFSSLFLYVTTQQLKSHLMMMMMIIQFFIIYVPSQQLQGQLQTQHSVVTGNCIMEQYNIKANTNYRQALEKKTH
jgi:hypothetical protein